MSEAAASHEGPVAVVTGGTRGIGAAICERLLADGWRVLATYVADAKAAEALAARYPRLAVRRADVASTDDCEGTVAEAVERFGGLDHLVGNAAIARDGLVRDTTDEDWDTVMATNLSGAFRMIRAALNPIEHSDRGRVVTVSSVAAEMGNAHQASYAATKAGLLGLTRSLAREVARSGTTVNIVMPAPVEATGMNANSHPAFVQAITRKIPLHRLGRPDEVAHAVRFLLDDLSGFITGTTIVVDGGLSM